VSSWRSHRERTRLRPELLGLLVILGVTAAFYLAATKDLPFTGGHEVHLEFSSANQIAPNAPVRVAGVNVGKVKSIDAGPNHTASVTVSLDDEALPLHTDATARIRPRTFLEGAFFVDLRPGSPSAPELPNGGTIPMGQTSDPVQLDQILTSLQKPVRDSLRTAVIGLGSAFSKGGPEAINRTLPELDPLFRKGAVTSEAFTGTEPHDLSRAISSSSRAATALAHDRPALGGVVRDFSTVAAALADRQRELGASISGLDSVLREAPPTLDAFQAATPPARSLVQAARPLLRRAPSVVNPAVPLAGQVRKLLLPSQLPALVHEGTPAVRSLAAASPNGVVTFAGLRGPTSCLLNDVLPTLQSPVEDDDLTTGAPTYRELLWALTGLASASRNFDGNGFATRYYAGFGDELLTTPFGSPSQELLGLADQQIVGSRPRKPDVAPPLRPDVPCTQNERPNLEAATGPGGFSSASGQAVFAAPPGTNLDLPLLQRFTGAGK
jgi:phospholipid/cholesterol/gamma-HCH transport system substrate-binding protein